MNGITTKSQLMGRTNRRYLSAAVAALTLAGGLLLADGSAPAEASGCPAGTATSTYFCYTGAEQTWTVPAGVTEATFTVYGAEGGSSSGTGAGGQGGKVVATYSVTADSKDTVYVGQAGGISSAGSGYIGGGAGGDGAGGGGGSSGVSVPCTPGQTCTYGAVLTAGGGGGGGENGAAAGGAGGNAGADGATAASAEAFCEGPATGGGGGGGASDSAAGTAGLAGIATCGPSGVSGTAGAAGQIAANGGAGGATLSGGGGGGGGYNGGGGGGGGTYYDDAGSGGGGGGGGSSSVDSDGATNVSIGLDGGSSPDDGTNGEVIISYPLTITTPGLAEGTSGVAYSAMLAAVNGTSPYSWVLTGGSLPAGLSLSAGGVISGTPTTPGSSAFTVAATDSSSPAQSATARFSLTVQPGPLSVTTTSLPGGALGTAYSQRLSASGGTPPYTWSLASGSSLPSGLSLTSQGEIFGTPTAAGTTDFTVQVADSGDPQLTATRGFSVTVAQATPQITLSASPKQGNATAATPVTLTATVTGVAGAATPTGSVAFAGSASSCGTVALTSGSATCALGDLAVGSYSFSSEYSGDSNYTAGETASLTGYPVTPENPVITAALASKNPESKYGWYSAPVTVTFTCTAGSAPLTGPCPSPMTLSDNGADQVVTKTIDGTDGGTATVSVTVSIDQTAPKVAVTGITSKATYDAPGPAKITCAATESLSGLAAPCALTLKRTETAITWTATATSKAGVTATVTGKAALTDFYIKGAQLVKGRYVVTAGTAFTVEAYLLGVSTAPKYVDAVRAPAKPTKTGPAMKKGGTDLWDITVTIPAKSKTGSWSLGVLEGKTLHVIQLTLQT
jgi:hypothetical protein